MKIEMICTGEEVLSGQIVDTNAAWFANELMDRGIEMQRRITVGDRMEDLVSTFIERSFHADVILVNGGLGPTSDDMSAQAMAQAKGDRWLLLWRLTTRPFCTVSSPIAGVVSIPSSTPSPSVSLSAGLVPITSSTLSQVPSPSLSTHGASAGMQQH